MCLQGVILQFGDILIGQHPKDWASGFRRIGKFNPQRHGITHHYTCRFIGDTHVDAFPVVGLFAELEIVAT